MHICALMRGQNAVQRYCFFSELQNHIAKKSLKYEELEIESENLTHSIIERLDKNQ